jgi:hypothetical protein
MHNVVRLLAVLAVAVLPITVHGAAQPMAPGALLDVEAGRAIVADTSGHAMAVSLADGRPLWVARELAWPFLEVSGRVLALGRIEVRGIGVLLLLDASDGSVIDRIAFDVPEHVAATVMPRPNGSFSVQAEPTTNGARIHWREVASPLRGAVFGDGSDEPTITEGAFDLVLDAQRNFAVPVRVAVAAPPNLRPDLTVAEQVPGLGERQFRSLGDVAAMSPKLQPDGRFGAVWEWNVRVRAAPRAIVGPTLPYAYLPFAVADGLLIYRGEPAVWREADGRVVQQGARLVAWGLATGRERWVIDVLDTSYRGPVPP